MLSTLSSGIRISDRVSKTLSSDIKLSEGGTETLASDIRVFTDRKITKISRIRLSGRKTSIKASRTRICDNIFEILASSLRVYGTNKNTTESKFRIYGSEYRVINSSLRIWDEPLGYIDGNIGVRSLGRINIANRESESRASIIRKPAQIRICGQISLITPSLLYISTAFSRISMIRIYDIYIRTSESKLRLASGLSVSIASALSIWDKSLVVSFGTYPNVLLDGYSTPG